MSSQQNTQNAKSSKKLTVLIAVMLAVIVALVVIIVKISSDKPGDRGNTIVATFTPGGVLTAYPNETGDPSTPPTDAPSITDAIQTEDTGNSGDTGEQATSTATPAATAVPTERPTATHSGDLKLVDYSGRVEHLFTHSLIAFPELAYPKNVSNVEKVQNSYFIDCITVNEFKKIINALYEDGYMLVNINYIYELDSNGVPQLKKSFKFPEGKKPLVFSFDDTNYYSDRQGRGMIDKLVLIDGKVGTYTKHKDGTVVSGFDEEYIPILDRFVEEHPDFSFDGAKGMICLTGFDGILGYRTQRVTEGSGRTEADREREIEEVKPLIKALKETGWYFASHSYKHGWMSSHGTDWMYDDATKFHDEVIPLIGDTKIYVYPYGDWKRSSDNETCPGTQKVLNDYGFEYFCSVGVSWYTKNRSDLGRVILQDRANVDGSAFVWFGNLFNYDEWTGEPRFTTLNFREFYDDARNISYDDAVAAYKEWKGK